MLTRGGHNVIVSDVQITVGDKQIVPINEVQPYPGNPRQGHKPTLQRSVEYHGQYRSILAQRSTGYIVAGNNTWQSMRDQGAEHVSVEWIDVDDDRARRINAIDNRSNDLATYDELLRREFLADLDDLDGTGYDPGDLDELPPAPDRAGGAPGTADLLTPPEQDNYRSQYGVIVECTDEAEQERTYEKLRELGYKCRVVTV